MIARRIRQARLAAGLTQDETIERLNGRITKAALSYYENGKRTPHASILKALGEAFGVRAQWFIREQAPDIEWHAFRSLASLGARKRESIQGKAQRQAEDYMEVLNLFPAEERTDFPKRRKVRRPEEADAVAADLRKRWNLGQDALESATQCLENHGALIVHYAGTETKGFDGLSATVNKRHPLLIVNNEVPVDRLRFDLLHELGHVLMDTSEAGSEKAEERLAHRFASSFLAPPDMVRRELGEKRRSLTLSELLMLKGKYGLSVSAWVYAAKAHSVIDQALYKALFMELNKRGWRKAEPAVFGGNEQPTLLRQLILRAVTEGLMGSDRAMEIMPEIREQLEREGLLRQSRAKAFATLSPAERHQGMREAAASAAEEYESSGALEDALEYEGDAPYEYE